MTEHREREPERDVDEMQERTDRLEDEIESERDDWERMKQDPGVPGATGEPGREADSP